MCGFEPKTQDPDANQTSFPTMHYLQRNNVRLAYTEAGSGPTSIVLIHGWLGDHTALAPQFDHFKRTHRTIAVDLRGHGESDKPEQDYTVAGFADDISWLCAQLGIVKPIIIGHSMGGNIALEIAAHYPALATAIVLLDTVIFPLLEIKDNAIMPTIEALRGPDYREAIRLAISGLFHPLDDQVWKARLVEQAVATPQHVALSALLSHTVNFNATELAAACKIPVAYVAATNPMVDLTPFRTLCPQLVTSQVMLAGHYAQLLVPEQVNDMIERFLSANVVTR
jgi:pimeloyl-ACP methyl ester carboxylesterase